MLGKSKIGRGAGAGEYYLRGQMAEAERFTGKEGQFYGDFDALASLGLERGQAVDDQTFRCLLRGMDPAKGKVAFHEVGGDFNPEGLLRAAWSDADPAQRKQIMADLKKAGAKLSRLSATSSTETLASAFEVEFTAAGRPAALEKACFTAAGRVPGYTLVRGAGPDRQTGYDFTATLPKDVSVLWARADPAQREMIGEIVRQAGDRVVDYFNAHAGITRAGKGGEDSIGCKFVSASFLDYVARPVDARGNELPSEDEYVKLQDVLGNGIDGVFVDPHLHAHIVVPNTALCDDGTWRAVDGPRLYAAQAAAGEVFHTAVAQGLRERMGIAIENNLEGVAFTLPEIPRAAVEECSKRTQIIAAEKDARGLANVPNQDIGRKLWDTIKLSTRGEHITLTNEQLDAHLHGRLDGVGFTDADAKDIFAAGQERLAAGITHHRVTKAEVLEAAQALLENESTFTDHKLRAAVLGRFTAEAGHDQILGVVNQTLAEELVLLGEFDGKQQFTTPEMLALEANYLDIAKHGKHRSRITQADIEKSIAIVSELKAKDGKPMSKEQADAARHLLSGDGIVSVLVGPAGAGKTYTLEAVQHCLKAGGYTILGSALSWSASEQLRAEGKLDKAAAVAKLCHDIKQGRATLDEKTVIVLDEGSLVSSREMGTLLVAARDAGARVLITGDTEQIQAVGAGAAMRAIVEQTGAFELEVVRRQSAEWDRQAGLDIRAGGDKLKAGIEAHIAHDRLHIASSDADARREMFDSWQAYRSANPDSSQLMIARRNTDVDELNRLARESLHAAGELGKDFVIEVQDGAEKKQLPFAKGDFIQFRMKSAEKEFSLPDGTTAAGQVFNRTRATITDIRGDAKGGVSEIDVELWAGDQRTGKRVTMTPKDFRGGHFAMSHAYAVTPDSSQGMTVNRCLVLPMGMDTQRVYVSLSRHRHDMQMFVSRDATHQAAARFMEHTKFTDRNDWTDALAKEALIAALQRKQGKQTTLDYVSDKARFAGMSVLHGTRYESLAKTNAALVETWRHIEAGRTSLSAAKEHASAAKSTATRVAENLSARGMTGPLAKPSLIHSPDGTQQVPVKNHRDEQALKASLMSAAKAWGSRIYLTGKRSFHAACVKVARELKITFGSRETAAYLKEMNRERDELRSRDRQLARDVARGFGIEFQPAGAGLPGSAAGAAAVHGIHERRRERERSGAEDRVRGMSAGHVASAQPEVGTARTDGILQRHAPGDLGRGAAERDGGRASVQPADPGAGAAARSQGEGKREHERVKTTSVPKRDKDQGMSR